MPTLRETIDLITRLNPQRQTVTEREAQPIETVGEIVHQMLISIYQFALRGREHDFAIVSECASTLQAMPEAAPYRMLLSQIITALHHPNPQRATDLIAQLDRQVNA